MSFAIAPLLIHDQAVPVGARRALAAAYAGGRAPAREMLESAAKILYAETDLDCAEVRELMGLSSGGDCGA